MALVLYKGDLREILGAFYHVENTVKRKTSMNQETLLQQI